MQEIDGSDKGDEEKEREKRSWSDLAKLEEQKSINIWDKKRKEILDQPKRQIENKRIQTIENKLYSTVAKSTGPSSYNDHSSNEIESEWQTVHHKRKPRNQKKTPQNNYNSRNFYWNQGHHRQKWY